MRALVYTAPRRLEMLDFPDPNPKSGEVLEELKMPPDVRVSGLESDGGDRLFCGGGPSGKVRAVRRPRRGSAAGGGS